jgi:peptide/nickel transport system substrate-binding protein
MFKRRKRVELVKIRRRTRSIAVVMAVSLVFAACSGATTDDTSDTEAPTTAAPSTDAPTTAAPSTEPAPDPRGTTLTVAHFQEPPTWDYLTSNSGAIRVPIFMNVIEPLMEFQRDGSNGPLVAESWEISDDGLVYTFAIREGVFHDGSTLEAADVVYSLKANQLSPIGPISGPLSVVDSIEALDERTVQLTLSGPSQLLFPSLANRAGMIVPEGSLEANDIAGGELIGSGPFVFTDFKTDVGATFLRFEDYWGELPYFEVIEYRYITEQTSELNALLAGDIDMAVSFAGDTQARLPGLDDDFTVHGMDPKGINYMFLSARSDKLADLRVRQAISHALDRDPILTAAVSGYGFPTCQYIEPYAAPFQNDYCPYPYDPARAMELLAEAGASDLEIQFVVIDTAAHPTISLIVADQLEKVGITVDVKLIDIPTWFDQVFGQGQYEISNVTGGVTIDAFACGGGREPIGDNRGAGDDAATCDEEYQALLEAVDKITDYDEFIAAQAELAAVFADNAWVIPLYSRSSTRVARSDLIGISPYMVDVEFDMRGLRWDS